MPLQFEFLFYSVIKMYVHFDYSNIHSHTISGIQVPRGSPPPKDVA